MYQICKFVHIDECGSPKGRQKVDFLDFLAFNGMKFSSTFWKWYFKLIYSVFISVISTLATDFQTDSTDLCELLGWCVLLTSVVTSRRWWSRGQHRSPSICSAATHCNELTSTDEFFIDSVDNRNCLFHQTQSHSMEWLYLLIFHPNLYMNYQKKKFFFSI